ncbi:glycerophosphodiester phosphodiesterase family protein [Agromyces sp. SYSU T00194]|uniref:glycerophosphodiester phosphodiesterase family protein n=1 Tax=Agromyces chitinivorans TaxID=3158560 RepID=UPI003394DC27
MATAHGTTPLVIAHRGASGYRPEHTAPAYTLAVALGADAVEPDLVATRDGVLVVRHEHEISGTTDVASRPEFAARRTTREVDGARVAGWFTEDFTWAELATLRARERMPRTRPQNATFDGRFPVLRFRDLLALLDRECERTGREVALVAELKHASHFAGMGLPLDELVAAELAGAGWADGRRAIVAEAFELDVLDRLARRGVPGRRVFLLEASGAPADLVRALGSDAPAFDRFATPDGLAGLAGRVDGVSVDTGRLLGRDRDRAPDAARGASAPLVAPLAGAALVEAAHEHGLDVFTWTLRPENRFLRQGFRRGTATSAWGDWLGAFARIIETGVDGVFADHPDLALDARNTADTTRR